MIIKSPLLRRNSIIIGGQAYLISFYQDNNLLLITIISNPRAIYNKYM